MTTSHRLGGEITYRRVFAVPGFLRLTVASTLARTASQALVVALVLFVLERLHSPELVGLTVLLGYGPGLMVSPVMGGLVDRLPRVRLIVADYALAAVTSGVIGMLSLMGLLHPVFLFGIVAMSSFTWTLSMTGTRTLLPIIVPRALWDRANAIDSAGYVIATIAGPGLAGILVASLQGEGALLCIAGTFTLSAFAALGITDPTPHRQTGGSLIRDSLAGIRYVFQNRILRGLAATITTINLAWGAALVIVPIVVIRSLHQGPAAVGILWAINGACGLVASLLSGRFDSEGRERRMMTTGILIQLAGLSLFTLGQSSLLAVTMAMALLGAGGGPVDIALFSLRQRTTGREWLGRAFAVSMSLNFAGVPIGSAVAGILVFHSLARGLGFALIALSVASLCPFILLPRSVRPDRSTAA